MEWRRSCSGNSPRPNPWPRWRASPTPRKVAVRIGLHVGRAVPAADSAPARAAIPDARYTVTGIATGFGALPGFVILQADDGSTST